MDKILNVPNAQMALSIVRKQLNEINDIKPCLLNDIKSYYKLADKKDSEGRKNFKLLNQSKDYLRSLRNEENSLILINKLLKKFIRENKEDTNNTPVINYLPTVSEFEDRYNKCNTSDLVVNKLFPTVSYKDVKRWFKNNHDKDYIKLFNVKITNDNLTNIVDYDTIYRESLKDWKDTIKDYSFIFSADCFSAGYDGFIGTGHRKEYVQKCIDLYGSVICKFKDELLDNYSGITTVISKVENRLFKGESVYWKYAEVTIENFR